MKLIKKINITNFLAIGFFSIVSIIHAKPNFVIFFADDLGYGDVSYQGGDVETPNIDSIAANGVQFTDGYVTCAVCAPSRAGLLTGKYQQRFGFWDNIGPYRANSTVEPGIPTDLPIISERLRELGYVTGLFGKTHDGSAEEMMAFNRWDEFYGFNNGASNYLGDMNRSHNPIFHNKVIVSRSHKERNIDRNSLIKNNVIYQDSEKYLTDQLGDQAVSFIKNNKDRPFLCFIPFNAIHGPFQATKADFDRFKNEPNRNRALVKAMLHSMDRNVGKVLNTLREKNLMENTLIIFLSDNGGHEDSPNKPLRGKKGTFWEGGLRIPFCLQWQGKLNPGTVYTQPVISLDILPTLIAASGNRINPKWQLDGVNLLPHIAGKVKQAPHPNLYWSWGSRKAIRQGDFKAVSMDNGKVFKLFNLSKDISETTDLSSENQSKLELMIATHKSWEKKLKPQLWGWNKALGFKDPNFGKERNYHKHK